MGQNGTGARKWIQYSLDTLMMGHKGPDLKDPLNQGLEVIIGELKSEQLDLD